MDRQIIYVGQIPQDTDLLLTNKNTMVALGYLMQALLGAGTLVDGLACTPTSPASLGVQVGPGSIYGQTTVDATAYGSVAADTADLLVKQGIIMSTQSFACPAPVTAGQSVVYLVEAQYQDADIGSTVLPYYNASNPAVAYSGPNNTGVSQATVRQGLCKIQVKAGTPATTGTQATPAPDAGFTGLFAVTVANGATTITSGNIAQLTTAPFIGPKLSGVTAAIQAGAANFAADTSGTANTLTIALAPAVAALTNGMRIWVRAANTNTGAVVINANGLGNVSAIRKDGSPVPPGAIQANGIYSFVYDSNGTRWQMEGPTTASVVAGANRNFLSVTTSTTAATLSADEIILSDASGNSVKRLSVSQSYATGTTGAGGCDVALSGFSASSWAYEYLIYNPSTNTDKALLSASSTAPTLPSGYTFYKCTGEVWLDASKNLFFKRQYGSDCEIVVGTNPTALPIMASGTAGNPGTPTWASVATGNYVPPTRSRIRGFGQSATNSHLIIAPNNSYGAWTNTTNPPPVNVPTGTPVNQGNAPYDFAMQSSNIYWANDAGALLAVTGWKTTLIN